MSRQKVLAAVLLGLCLGGTPLRAQQAELLMPDSIILPDTATPKQQAPAHFRYFFYHPENRYGSDAIRTPLSVVVNRAFSTTVLVTSEDQLGEIDWGTGWRTVREALTYPKAAVRRAGGTRAWLHNEYLPSGRGVWTWAFAPNIGGHVIAGGISSRYMAEWFDARGVPLPRVAGGVALMVAGLGNEVIESQLGGPPTAATVADLLLHDPLGILLFQFDPVARLFANGLEAADWTPLGAITIPDGRLVNTTQVMSYKLPLPFVPRLRMLFMVGQGMNTGFRWTMADGYHIGGTIGFDTDMRFVDALTGTESIRANWSGGLYLDRNNSLLVSGTVSTRHRQAMQISVFPGVLPGRFGALGLWGSLRDDWGVGFGVAVRGTIGTGTGIDF